ncbi:MAG: ABC transporter substrate binding protein, partial [bacterium]
AKYNLELVTQAEKTSRELGLTLVTYQVDKGSSLDTGLEHLNGKVDAIWMIADPVVLSSADNLLRIFKQSETIGVPVFSYEPAFKNYGPTLTISADPRTIGNQVQTLVQTIHGRQNGNQVQDPVGTHITLNLQQVRKLKLEFNEEALDSVTELIQ